MKFDKFQLKVVSAFLLIKLTTIIFIASPSFGDVEKKAIFSMGDYDYNNYRIPALIVTKEGTILAFCEARTAVSDHGDIDLVLRRSKDAGATWLPIQTIYKEKDVVIGNPSPVQDMSTGRIWLHTRRADERLQPTPKNVLLFYSDDDGETWSKPVDIAKESTNPGWTHCFPGPGKGIVLQRGEKKGRLIIPGWHAPHHSSHVLYSDDNGKTWKFGGNTSKLVDESTVVELSDGRLMMNMRAFYKDPELKNYRKVAYSSDYGLTWEDAGYDTKLPCSSCQASILRYSWKDKDDKNRILFLNPNSSEIWKRRDLTLRISYDDGKSWPVSKLLHKGPCGYSDMDILPDGKIACIFEAGQAMYYENIFFSSLSMEWLEKKSK
jgi:sialidase-1